MILDSRGMGNSKIFCLRFTSDTKFYHIYGLKLLPDMLRLLTSNTTDSVAVFFNKFASM